jgi:hypothetical protein
MNAKTFERVFFEIQKIRRELEQLEDFILAQHDTSENLKPKTAAMMDPRTGQPFKK